MADQYRDSSRLDARLSLHEQFSTNTQGWHPWVFDQLRLPPDGQVLDLGCGSGALWKANSARIPAGWRIFLTDASLGMLRIARARLARVRALQVHCGADVQALPFHDRTFDGAIANHMLYHVPDIPRGLRELRRVMKPGAKLYAATNGAEHMAELWELVGSVSPGLSLAPTACEPFSLENGRAQLGKHFVGVRLHGYPDSLEIPEAGPLVEYAKSTMWAVEGLTTEAVDRLQQLIRERIVRDGAIRITKQSGLFEAVKPQE